ncbi:hypothetical protein VNI00_003863 [Paramarasmius palmivorus]|uniref:Uncharacterized protein n=1 Tax=Paramarasmius palmivorus TaxID=297713 RepID=A0AAW0DRM5_9AGAR
MLPPLPDTNSPPRRRGLPVLRSAEPKTPFNYPGHHLRDEERRRSPKKRVTTHTRNGAEHGRARKRQKSSRVYHAVVERDEDPVPISYEDTSNHFTGDAEAPPIGLELDADFESYIRLVESRCVGFIRISQAVYVVQGWNVKERMATFYMEFRDERFREDEDLPFRGED